MRLTKQINDFYEEKSKSKEFHSTGDSKVFLAMMPVQPYQEIRYVFTGIMRVDFKVSYEDNDKYVNLKFKKDFETEDVNRFELSDYALHQIGPDIYKNFQLTIKCDIQQEYKMFGYCGDLTKEFPWKEYKSLQTDFWLLDYDKFVEVAKKLCDFLKGVK